MYTSTIKTAVTLAIFFISTTQAKLDVTVTFHDLDRTVTDHITVPQTPYEYTGNHLHYSFTTLDQDAESITIQTTISHQDTDKNRIIVAKPIIISRLNQTASITTTTTNQSLSISITPYN